MRFPVSPHGGHNPDPLFHEQRRALKFTGQNGKEWQVEYCQWPMAERGHCMSPDVSDKERKIVVASWLTGKEELEVLIHECLHATVWALAEETVQSFGENVAELLWSMGYRRNECSFTGNGGQHANTAADECGS